MLYNKFVRKRDRTEREVKEMKDELTREQALELLRYAGMTNIKYEYAGKDNVQGCCPVHGESTPSMGYSFSKNVAHCFSCHWSGNIQWLLFKTCEGEFKSVYDVERWIRERYNVDLGKYSVDFTKNLRRYDDIEDAEEEIEEKQHELPRHFLAPFKSGKETYKYYYDRGFNRKDLVYFNVGRDLENETVTIPVYNADSTLCGVVGRYIDPNRPKNARYRVYEFPKGKVTYPIDKLEIKDDTLILVEGILDAMWLHKHGYTNAQSILGNGLTYEQCDLLKDYEFSTVILAFDKDSGGDTAINIAKKRLGDSYTYKQVIYPEGVKDVQEMSKEQLDNMFNQLKNGKRTFRRL